VVEFLRHRHPLHYVFDERARRLPNRFDGAALEHIETHGTVVQLDEVLVLVIADFDLPEYNGYKGFEQKVFVEPNVDLEFPVHALGLLEDHLGVHRGARLLVLVGNDVPVEG